MKSLFKYWYLLLLAFIVSLLTAFVSIYLRQAEWMPEPVVEEQPELEAGDSVSFREWHFSANELEDLRVKLEARDAAIDQRQQGLEVLSQQVEDERAELLALRSKLEELRNAIQAEYIEIEANEQQNLKQLADIYSAVKAEAAIKVFDGLDDIMVVKILSLMSSESSAKILGKMGESAADSKQLKRAAQITKGLRRVK